jgi:hypothetical protein
MRPGATHPDAAPGPGRGTDDDVETQSGGPGSTRAAAEDWPQREAGAIVGDYQTPASRRHRLQADRQCRVDRRVGEHVAHQGIHAGGEIGLADLDGHRMRRNPYADRPALLLGDHGPEIHPGRDHRRGVTRDCGSFPDRAVGFVNHVVHRAVDRVQVRDQAGPDVLAGQRFDVDAQRGERCPQPVRDVGHRGALLGEQLDDAGRQPVEAVAHLAHLWWPVVTGPSTETAFSEPVGHARDGGQGPGQPPREQIRHKHAHHQQAEAEQPEHQPRSRDAGGQGLVRDERPDHRGAVLESGHGHRHFPSAVDVRGHTAPGGRRRYRRGTRN